MNKPIIIIIILTIVTLTVVVLSSNQLLTGKTIDLSEFIYTRAICDENNLCQDYEVTCRKEELINIRPITGTLIQHPKDWQDPRNKTATKDFCKNTSSP